MQRDDLVFFYLSHDNSNTKRRLPAWSIRTKLVLIFLAVTVIPLCISSLLTYENSINTLRDEYINNNLKVLQQGGQNISNYLEELNQLSLSPYKNNVFMRNASFDQLDFSGTQYNENFLKSILFSRKDIAYLYYYITDSKILYSFSKQLYSSRVFSEIENEEWLKKTMVSQNGFFIAPKSKFVNYSNIGTSNANEVFTINRTIKDISNSKVLGVLSLVIDNKKLGEMCNSISSENEVVALFDNIGKVYYSSNLNIEFINQLIQKKQLEKDSGYYSLINDQGKSIVVFSKTYGNLILVKYIPYSLLASSSEKSLRMSTIIIIIASLAVIVLSILISYSITLPIKRLVNNMKKVGEGNFNIHIPHISNDEIGLLTARFNEMTEKVNSLINSEYKLKISKKNAQLRALQAQINPHFIYNALQSISTLAIRKEAPEIYTMTNAIANMLRYSLKSSNDLVTLSTEIDNMNNYLYVQKVRYSGRLKVDINIEDSVREFMVPRLILQPLIENSIKYGIDDEKPEEAIVISATNEGEFIAITVKDTGRGIDQNRLDMIREWLKQDEDLLDDGEHMGIKNVINRMKLIYGEISELTLDSKIGEGTCITLRMPLNHEKE